jgi:hypothetical protein
MKEKDKTVDWERLSEFVKSKALPAWEVIQEGGKEVDGKILVGGYLISGGYKQYKAQLSYNAKLDDLQNANPDPVGVLMGRVAQEISDEDIKFNVRTDGYEFGVVEGDPIRVFHYSISVDRSKFIKD